MAGEREKIVAVGITIQPTPGTYNAPNTTTDLIAVSAPDDGEEMISGADPTLTGSIWDAPRVFLGSKGSAGATAPLRGPGGVAPPAANAWVLGRVLQAAGFSELINATPIAGTAAAGGSTSAIQLVGTSAVDDFYRGFPIQHATIGSGFRRTSLVRSYVGSSKIATLGEVVGSAIVAGAYNIPACLVYLLGTAASVPLLSASVWRHHVRRNYRDCALASFAINIPVSNDQVTDSPTIDFALVGVPVAPADETAPPLPTALLTAIPPAKAGKFVFNGVKIGHQSIRYEFGLSAGAPPNQNFDAGQESYEVLSGTRTMALDLNQTLLATLDVKPLVDAQTPVAIMETHGMGLGNRFGSIMFNALLDPFKPAPRNGFVGLASSAQPNDIDKGMALAIWWDTI